MSAPKFTPGPWKTVGAKYVWKTGGVGGAVAIIAEPECKNSSDFAPVRLSSKRWNEAMANADLISAAPELYEALKAIIPAPGYNSDWWCPRCRELKHGSRVTNAEHCEDCGTFLGDKQPGEEWIEKGRAALAKAEGGEQ